MVPHENQSHEHVIFSLNRVSRKRNMPRRVHAPIFSKFSHHEEKKSGRVWIVCWLLNTNTFPTFHSPWYNTFNDHLNSNAIVLDCRPNQSSETFFGAFGDLNYYVFHHEEKKCRKGVEWFVTQSKNSSHPSTLHGENFITAIEP